MFTYLLTAENLRPSATAVRVIPRLCAGEGIRVVVNDVSCHGSLFITFQSCM